MFFYIADKQTISQIVCKFIRNGEIFVIFWPPESRLGNRKGKRETEKRWLGKSSISKSWGEVDESRSNANANANRQTILAICNRAILRFVIELNLPTVVYRTNVSLFSSIASTASFSQYWAVMMAMVGCLLEAIVGICLTTLISLSSWWMRVYALYSIDLIRPRSCSDLITSRTSCSLQP